MPGLTAERMWDIPRVGAPAVVVGERLIVPVTTYDAESDEPTTTLWRIEASGESRRFAEGTISGVRASPDGTAIAYLKKVGEHRQVFVQPVDGGEGRQLGDLPLGAVGATWMPDGRLLALATLRAEHPDLQATAEYEPKPNSTARVTESAVFRHWDTWLDHVYHPVILSEEAPPLDLTPGATNFWSWPNTGSPVDDLAVSPDGSLVAFCVDDSEPPHRYLSWSLHVIEADGSGRRRLDSKRPGNSHRPRFTADGVALVYGYQAEADYYASPTRLIHHDLDTGSERTWAEGWDRSPTEWVLEDDGGTLLVAEDAGRSRLWRLPAGASEPVPLTDDGWVSDLTTDGGGAAYFVHHSLSSPPEVHRFSDGTVDRVTTFTEQATGGISLRSVAEVEFPGAEGRSIQMWLVDPPDEASDPPVVHMIHGGPHGVFGDAWHWRWNAQVVAAGGFRVALVNFHGSTGWGDAFARSIHGAWGDLPYRDIEAASDYLVAAGLAQPDRIAVTGGSYGGYLVAWITSQTDRYACAIAHAAVTDLGGMHASDLTYGLARAFGAEVWEDPARIARFSPSVHAAGFSTPTLVIHGSNDFRVPLTQGLEYYGVLVAKGVPARLVAYPEQNHWILSRADSIHWYGEFLQWLHRWV